MIEIFVPAMVGAAVICGVMIVEIIRSGLSTYSNIYDKIVSGYLQYAIIPALFVMLAIGLLVFLMEARFKIATGPALVVYASLYVAILLPLFLKVGLIDATFDARSMVAVLLFAFVGILHLACVRVVRFAGGLLHS